MRFLILLFSFTLTATAAEALVPRDSALIDRDKVLVGDLFDVQGDVALQPVGDAPAPGMSHTFDAYALRRVANAYNLGWAPTRLDIRAVVKRDSTPVTNQQIRDAVRNAVTEKMSSQNISMDNLDVILDRHNMEVQLPASVTDPVVRVIDLAYNPADYRFKGMLMIETGADGVVPTLLPLNGRAIPNVKVPTLVHTVTEGTVLTEADVEYVLMPVNKTGGDIILSIDQLSGKEMRRDVAQGQLLRSRDIRPQQLVKRGGMVTMVVESGAMRVTAQGRALANAAEGETVRVMNSISNRVIEGKVLPDGNVSIARAI
ncbi:MAG: flagellar basal body P-ring formation chaperone FlgA [Bdellovibrionales bacterium]